MRIGPMVSTVDAIYVASARTDTVLVFRYTVTGATDDYAAIYVSPDGLELNGGTIRNQGTAVNADLAHGTLQGLPTQTRLVDDIAITSTPRVSPADSGGVPTYGPGEVIEFTVTFADTVGRDRSTDPQVHHPRRYLRYRVRQRHGLQRLAVRVDSARLPASPYSNTAVQQHQRQFVALEQRFGTGRRHVD